LDRDGTINREINYLHRVEDLRLLPKTADALNILRKCGFKIIVISNQSGIARGIFTEKQLHIIQNEIIRRLKRKGIIIDNFYNCPHHPEGINRKYSIKCNCRKPAPGLFQKAVKDFGIDPSISWAIGDRIRDLEGAVNIGCKSILVMTGYGKKELKNKNSWPIQPDYIAGNLYNAASIVKDTFNGNL